MNQFMLNGTMKITDHSHRKILEILKKMWRTFILLNFESIPRNVRAVGKYLEFLQITPSSAGRYYCSANNPHGNVTKTAEVNLHHNEIPDRVVQGRVQEILEGETVSLECTEPSSPDARVRKFKNIKIVSNHRLKRNNYLSELRHDHSHA